MGGRINRDKSVNLPELPKNNNLSTEKGSWFGKAVKNIGKDIEEFGKDVKHIEKHPYLMVAVAAVVATLALIILALPLLVYYLAKDSPKPTDKQVNSPEIPKGLPNLTNTVKKEPVEKVIEKIIKPVVEDFIIEKTVAKEKLPNLGELKVKYPHIKNFMILELFREKNEDELVDLTEKEQFIINRYFPVSTIKSKSISKMKEFIEATEKKEIQGYLKDLAALQKDLSYYKDTNNYKEISSKIISKIDPENLTNKQIKDLVEMEIETEKGRIQHKLSDLNKTIDVRRMLAYKH